MSRWYPILISVWRKRLGSHGKRTKDAGLSGEEIKMIAAGVTRLSRGFTGNRRLVGADYLSDPELLGAYLLFYWPVSYAQARTVLADLKRRGVLPAGTGLDLGSGPGPVAFAMFDAGFETVYALEKIAQALEIARDLANAAGIGDKRFLTLSWEVKIANGKIESRAPAHVQKRSVDLIACGHMLNELGPVAKTDGTAPAATIDLRSKLLGDFSPLLTPAGSFMILEPALKPVTRNLLELRDKLAFAGTAIRGPCFFYGPCPALALPGQTCHGQVNWTIPETLRRLADAAHIAKEELAMAWLATGPVAGNAAATRADGRSGGMNRTQDPETPESENPWRVVGEAMLNKAGRTRFMICGPGGRISLSLKRGDLIKAASERRETPAANRPIERTAAEAPNLTVSAARSLEASFFSLRRGSVIKIEHAEVRENGLGVGAETRLTEL